MVNFGFAISKLPKYWVRQLTSVQVLTTETDPFFLTYLHKKYKIRTIKLSEVTYKMTGFHDVLYNTRYVVVSSICDEVIFLDVRMNNTEREMTKK